MTAPAVVRFEPSSLLASRVAALSVAAPYAVPAGGFGADLVRLVSGAPAPEALPLADYARVASELLTDPVTGPAALEYGPHSGIPELRAWIAAREGVRPDRILVTNGGLHGVSLAFSALLDDGDSIAVDDPVFPDTLRVAEQQQARVLPIPVGADGLDVDALEWRLRSGQRIKVLYTVPDFHNPSGGVLPGAQRQRIVELAEHYGFVIVSDNPYREYGFTATPEPDFSTESDQVVRVGTFTKTLGAGLRLGWIVAPAWLAPHLENVRRRTDFHSSVLSQRLIAALLGQPDWFDALVAAGRRIYANRAVILADAVRSQLAGVLEFDDPVGGFFLWAEIVDPGIDPATLLVAAAEQGLLLTAGRNFAATGGSAWDRRLRLAYSSAPVEHLTLGVDRLSAAVATLR
ncbi:MAG: PLP-dependent aminotransferase family protein [Nakamurella sp.]